MSETTPTPAEPTEVVDIHHGVAHVVSFKILFNVFAALCVLTAITVGASYVNFGELNLVVALVIAVIKASLVVLYFMHLRWDKPFNSIVFIGCLVFVSLFIALALLDTGQYHRSMYYDVDKDGVGHSVGHNSHLNEVEHAEKPETPAGK